jgi:hypothetical protein
MTECGVHSSLFGLVTRLRRQSPDAKKKPGQMILPRSHSPGVRLWCNPTTGGMSKPRTNRFRRSFT